MCMFVSICGHTFSSLWPVTSLWINLVILQKQAPLTCAENSTDLWEQTYIFKRQFDYMPFGKIPVMNISPRACSLIRNFLSGLQCQPYSIPME